MKMKHCDHNILQTRTTARMILLIKDLMKYSKHYSDVLNTEENKGTKDAIENSLKEGRFLLKMHHLALNSLKVFNNKTHPEQLKYMFSEELYDRYRMP